MAIFLTVYPRDFATGTPFEVKATSNGGDFYVNRAGGPWLPALTEQTSLKRDFFDGDFSQALKPPSASLKLSVPALATKHPDIARARWAGAKVIIEYWEGGTAETLFTGVVSGFNQQAKLVTLNAEIDTEPFEADALPAEYAGTTGIEGVEDLQGNPKPFLLGRCYGVEPVLVDVVDNVYQISAYGPIQDIIGVYERGASFGDKVGDYANYAALVAADIKEGQWGSCLAQGLFRLGAPAYGVITADVDGDKPSTWLSLTGAIIKRVCTNAGVDAGLIDAASLDAMDADKPYAIGIHMTDQQSVLEVARRLCLPLNYQIGIDANGKLFALKLSLASPTLTLNGQGAAMPAVIGEPVEQNTSPPYKRIMMGWRRCWRVHSNDEIATAYNLVERGTWVITGAYREGNIVNMPDGSRWVYIAEQAGDTDTPGSDPLVWQALSGSPQNYVEPGNKAIIANADYLGVVPTSALPIGFTVRRFQGVDNVSATATWTIESVVPSGAATATVNASGGVSITAISQSCTFIVRSVRDGITLDCTIAITRQDAAPPSTGGGSGGTTVNDTSFASFSGTSHVSVSDILTVKTGAAGQIALSANLEIRAAAEAPIGAWNAALQWAHRPVGGSFTNLAEVGSSAPVAVTLDSESGGYIMEPGAVNSSPTVTGLSANTDYEVQLFARRSSGASAKTLTLTGNSIAIGS